MTAALKNLAAKLALAQKVNVIVHQNPDGDAVGSAIAIGQSFPDKTIVISCNTAIADIYKKIVGEINFSKSLVEDADLYLVVDCSEAHRTGFAKELNKISRQKICIVDHHRNGNLPKQAEISLIAEDYCSTTEIIDDLLREMRIKVNPSIATALLLGIFTDTGGFRHSNTHVNTLRRASHLISNGGNIQKITQTFFQRLSPVQRKLWGEVLVGIEVNKWGIAIAKITKRTLQNTQASVEDAFGLANNIALVNEAVASLVLIEQDNQWRGILRTRHHQINIGRLAKLLGGRGQQKAAGFTATNTVFSDIINN